ncbi:MAG: H-NS histone family protein [Chlorobiales bacterium]|jgi:DNA-binding protein H-NS|nr:H-NS histone family protein [Chlorobiales bacterium]
MSSTRLAEIKSQLSELQKEADEIIRNERITIIKDIQDKISNYNITIDELQRKGKIAKTASTKSPAVIKYKKSEHEYWVGRGPKPGWVKDVENSGESIEQYRVPV